MKRIPLAAAVAVLFAGAAQAATTEFIIFPHPNFTGDRHVIKGEVNNLEGNLAGKGSSLEVKGGFWQVCTGHHFTGDCYVLKEGRYPWLGVLDDRIVAVKFLGTNPTLAGKNVLEPTHPRLARTEVPSQRQVLAEERREARDDRREARREDRREARRDDRRDGRDDWRGNDAWMSAGVDLYGRPDFRGRSVRIEDNARDLSEHRFDGRASSVIVHEGTWQLCTEPGYRGRCSVLRPGQYPQLAMFDDRVSSMRRLY
jgi:hypothetical protein